MRVALFEPLFVIAVCIIAALANPGAVERAIDRGLGALRQIPVRVLSGVLSACMIGLAVGFGWYCFRGQPVLTDEFSQLFQSSILLDGRLTARPESLPEFFDTAQTIRVADRWFSEFPVGGPILLAIARLARAEWILNPVLAALSLVLLFGVVRQTYGETTARVVAVMFALSPFVLFMSASRMNHPMALAAQMVALYGLALWEGENERKVKLGAGLIGAGLGAMATIRPYDAVLVAVPVGVFQLARVWTDRRKGASLAVQVAVGLLLCAVVFAVNSATTGHATLFGYDLLNGPQHRPGFHVDPMGRSFTPGHGAYLASLYLTLLNTALFESPIPALALVIAALLIVRRPMRWDYLHLGIIVATVVGYGLYWFNGQFVGPRFLYPAVPSFIVFVGRLAAEARATFQGCRTLRLTALLVVPACLVLAWMPIGIRNRPTGVWLRAYAHRMTPESRQPDVEGDVRAAGLTNALVFVREPLHARLAARLRALGMKPYAAERAAADLDACSLMESLFAEGARASSSGDVLDSVLTRARLAGMAQPVRGLFGTRSLALIDGRPGNAVCAAEIARDSSGTFLYDAFLARSRVDSTGRLGGPVVFARDMGSRNELLRERFGGRVWLRYRPSGSSRSFEPY